LRKTQLEGMAENSIQQTSKRKKNTETASTIAGLAGVTPAYVRMVLNGEKENQEILDAAIIYEEGKNELLEKVRELVPFDTKKAI
jgi:predicted transcriptional regulator